MGAHGILAGILTLALVLPAGMSAAEEVGTVNFMVELKSSDSLELRQSIREIQKISDRAPRSYLTDSGMRRAKDLRRWRVIEVEADKVPALKAELEQNPAVASVHEEQVYEAAVVPNDVRFSEQIGLQTEAWPLDINAPEAWEKTTGSGNTVIAIVDGGVDLAHEDLKDKLWTGASGEHGWDFVADAPARVAIDHATHVAGIAAASSNNATGVAGVDWGARIMSVRVLGSGGFGGEINIIRGINYAVANGADVINLSIAGPGSQALLDAVENAYASGVVVVAAAGNSGINTSRFSVMPGCADVSGVNTVLGVGALDEEGIPANFSNYGRCVDVSAPGKDILSTKVGDRYGTMKGTSMSSPFAAGVAGLYLSLHPNANPAEVIGAITGNMTAFTGEKADDWKADYKGRLNAAGVVGSPGTASGSGQSGGNSDGGGDSGGGGNDSGGGGGDSGGPSTGSGSSADEGGSEEPQPTPKPRVLGVSAKISAADRKAPDFIQNKNVPVVVARLFQSVWGRKITPQESTYWKARARSDKATETKLFGAMMWHKARGKTHTKALLH